MVRRLSPQEDRTLGSTIRGARLGYGWVELIHAFVRIEPAGPGRWLVEAVPVRDVPHRPTDREHVVWWAAPSQAAVARMVRRNIAGGLRSVWLQRRVAGYVDDDGQPVPA